MDEEPEAYTDLDILKDQYWKNPNRKFPHPDGTDPQWDLLWPKPAQRPMWAGAGHAACQQQPWHSCKVSAGFSKLGRRKITVVVSKAARDLQTKEFQGSFFSRLLEWIISSVDKTWGEWVRGGGWLVCFLFFRIHFSHTVVDEKVKPSRLRPSFLDGGRKVFCKLKNSFVLLHGVATLWWSGKWFDFDKSNWLSHL